MATQEVRSQVSETSICNQALLWLGEPTISSLEEDTDRGEWMRNNYPFLRDAVLEERMWTFATDRTQSTVADMDEWGNQYVHPIPESWLGVYRVFRASSGRTELQDETWRREGSNILSMYATINIWGLKRVVDTGQYTSLFVQALAARIAADACIPFTQNRALQSDAWRLYEVKLREAAARDGMQGANERINSSSLITARYGRGGNYG